MENLKLNINEIFFSIQGEGTRFGLPCVFVRLQGCLLRCVWCDTPYALDKKEIVKIMNGNEIYDEVKKYNCKFVMFTGGEPLEQEDIFPLIAYFCENNFDVVIETNGQADISKVDERAIKIFDIKCPDSKMHKKNNFKNINYLNKKDEVKFVVASKNDFIYAEEITKKYNLEEIVENILISPVFDKINLEELAEMVKFSDCKFRMQLQIHKYIWEPNKKGV